MKIFLSTIIYFSCFAAFGQSTKIDTAKTQVLDDVIVTGQYQPQSLKNSVYNVRTINAEKIRLRGASNVQQILSTELGFRFSNDLTLGTTDVQLMGMTGRNVKILLDGVPMVDRSDTRESLNQIDINTVDRIEIVEGPMSVIYGTDALAGVINIITKNAGKSLLSLSARIQEETAGKEYNPFGDKGNHIQNITGSWQKNGFSVLIGATHNDFGGWNLAPKTATIAEVAAVPNRWKPKEQWLGNAKIGYKNDRFNIWYRIDGLNETIDTRLGINPSNYKGKLQTYTTERLNNQIQSEWKYSDRLQLTAIAGYTTLNRATRSVRHDYTTGIEELTTDAGEQDIAKFNSTIFRATAQYKLSKSIYLQPGFEFNRDAATADRISGSPSINDYALFLSAEIKPVPGINIRPGVRFIENSVYKAPPAIPSINTKFSLNKEFDLRLAYARGFRAPALRELYYNFIDASHTIIGNPDLKAEQSNSYNGSLTWAGIKIDDFKFHTSLAGFYNAFKNRIDYGLDANDASITTLINVSKYKTTGFTLDNILVYKNLQANLGISYIGRFNQFSEDRSDLNLPEFKWATELSANLIYNLPKINGSISVFYKYSGALPSYQLKVVDNLQTVSLVKIAGFSLADITLNKNIIKSLTINAGIKNVFNVTQLSNSATTSTGAHSTGGNIPYSYGRSYQLGLTYNWSKI